MLFRIIPVWLIFLYADCSQNGLDHPSVDLSLEDSSGILVDGFERTYDGKLKCRYCNYATRGTARLIEHIRIHTGKCQRFILVGLIHMFRLIRLPSSIKQERNLIAATSVHLLPLTSATWRPTCDRTRARSLTSVSCAPSAAATAATCRTIAADATSSCR